MNETANTTTNSESELYPIRTVSELTGVNAITLRAWERRHGLFEPVRKESGHRLYTREHIVLITRIVGLLDRGMRISQVKDQLNVNQQADSEVSNTSTNLWKRYLDRMIASVIQFDESGLEVTYGEALSLYPVEVVTEKLLMPLLTELGRRWETNAGSIAEEHFFGFYVRNKLGARFHHRVVSNSGPKLLLACLPGDRHETGLILFALAANEAGYRTILLGADMPLDELPAAALKTGAAAIVLSGLVEPSTKVLKQGLPTLGQSVNVPVYLGGRASATVHDALKRANIQPLGSDLHTGLRRIMADIPLRP